MFLARFRSLRTACAVVACVAFTLPALPGCTTKSGATYKPDEAGRTMEVRRGTITQARAVTVEGLNEGQQAGWGTVVGATVAGAGAYGLTGADTPLGVAVTIIAAIGGALAGTVLEEKKNRFPGAEYIVNPGEGQPFGVVQTLTSGEEIIPAGQKVLILYGRNNFVRIVPDK